MSTVLTLLQLVGVALVVAGCTLVALPLGLIVAGVALFVLPELVAP